MTAVPSQFGARLMVMGGESEVITPPPLLLPRKNETQLDFVHRPQSRTSRAQDNTQVQRKESPLA